MNGFQPVLKSNTNKSACSMQRQQTTLVEVIDEVTEVGRNVPVERVS